MKLTINQIQTDTLKTLVSNSENIEQSSIWFWLSIIELGFIIFLISRLKKKKTKLPFSDIQKSQIKNTTGNKIDMNNLFNSISSSRDLYKELSKKCHPDRFVNKPEQKIAEELFKEITKNQRNYEKLIQLQERAINELNINL